MVSHAAVRAVVALLALAAVASAALSPIHGSASDKYLRDAEGRPRLFRGVNLVIKYFPWYPHQLLNNETRIKEFADLGINTVRLGMMWSGAQPTPGAFNETYFDVIETIVSNLASHGIYTLFDMHQDGFSSKFCLYDGIPLWVANKSVARRAFPWPLPGDCSRPWSENELAEASGQAYGDLYHNVGGMRDDFVAFWRRVTQRFRGNPNVVGFELINEPFAGDVYADPLLLLPGEAGAKDLSLLYDAVAPAIVEEDPSRLILYEPVTWGMIFNGTVLGSGFTHVPGGEANRNRSVLSFHYYCWFYDIGDGKPTNLRRELCEDGLGPQVFRAVAKDIETLGGAAFLTEFGATTCDDDRGNGTECMHIMDHCDQDFVSWTAWPTGDDYSNDVYNLTEYVHKGFARPYPQAVAGTPTRVSLEWQQPGKPLTVCWRPEEALLAQPTVLFSSPLYYPGGAVLKTSAPLTVHTDGNLVMLYANSTEPVCAILKARD